MTDEEADIIKRLELSCDGHPFAKIAWPHRLLHDAISLIKKKIEEATDLKGENEALRKKLQMMHRRAQIAETAINKAVKYDDLWSNY